MSDLYTWPMPNGHKVHLFLGETGLEHTAIPVNISAGDQFDPEFLKISPNNKMPAMVDRDGPGGKLASRSEAHQVSTRSRRRCSAGNSKIIARYQLGVTLISEAGEPYADTGRLLTVTPAKEPSITIMHNSTICK